MSFQRSGKTPSPEGYRNLGKSRSCQHSGILQDCFHRAGALESLQRFALQAFQRSGKCRQELADRFVLQDFKRQNGTALVGGETVSSVTTKHYCVYYNVVTLASLESPHSLFTPLRFPLRWKEQDGNLLVAVAARSDGQTAGPHTLRPRFPGCGAISRETPSPPADRQSARFQR